MRLKNIDFAQPPKLLINGVEYESDHTLTGTQKAFNKGSIKYNNVIPKGISGNDLLETFTIFPKFARVEHYYGDELFFLGFVKEQSGDLDPIKTKYVNLTVLDGKDWLTQSEPIDKIFINTPYEAAVDYVVQKLGLSFIKKGKMQFTGNGLIEAWDSDEIDAYSVLRFIEKQSNTLLEITLESDKTYSINFFSKAGIANVNGNKGVDMDISTPDKLNAFKSSYILNSITWKKSSQKDNNISRVTAQKIKANVAILSNIDLASVNSAYPLVEKVSDINKKTAVIKDMDGNEIRKAKVVTQEEAQKGKKFDIAFTEGSQNIEISEKLYSTQQTLSFEYFAQRRGTVQLENTKDQADIALYTGGTGKKYRYEKHNDAGIIEHLIKYAQRYLELGVEPKITLTVTTTLAPWDVGEHVTVTTATTEVNGIYYVKQVKPTFKQQSDGVIIAKYIYTLTQQSDFEDEVNFYDDQAYRQKPVTNQSDEKDQFENITLNVLAIAEKATMTCIAISTDGGGLENELEHELSDLPESQNEIIEY